MLRSPTTLRKYQDAELTQEASNVSSSIPVNPFIFWLRDYARNGRFYVGLVPSTGPGATCHPVSNAALSRSQFAFSLGRRSDRCAQNHLDAY